MKTNPNDNNAAGAPGTGNNPLNAKQLYFVELKRVTESHALVAVRAVSSEQAMQEACAVGRHFAHDWQEYSEEISALSVRNGNTRGGQNHE